MIKVMNSRRIRLGGAVFYYAHGQLFILTHYLYDGEQLRSPLLGGVNGQPR